MYAEGNNTSAIARILNTMKIPTRHQGKGWQQNTVAKILKREGVYVEGHVRRGGGEGVVYLIMLVLGLAESGYAVKRLLFVRQLEG